MAYGLIAQVGEKLSIAGDEMPYIDIGRIAGSDDETPPDEAPDTPTDEPKPAPVQDPPAEPDPTPYVV